MNAFFSNIKDFLSRLTTGQQVALGTVILGGVALLIAIAYWAGRPDYTLLFGKLESSDANSVVEALRSQGVKYELRDNGSSVFVPRDQVYELRLQFAGEGLVSDGALGYELFDNGTMGMTDFMQRLNLKRALEGELARTISSIRQVEMSRVHLVLPERSPFREMQTQPSASVVLQLRNDASLNPEQINGITELVSGAVEGLPPSGVTILDSRGNLLSNPDAGNSDAAISSGQLKMQRSIENHLTQSGQSMLDQVLGSGNSIVRVAASLDFSRIVAEKEIIDPESATVISEEKLEEQDAGGTGNANSSVRNYVLSRTNERSEKGVGDVSYLTVSVILNNKQPAPAEDGAEPAEPEPYTGEELANIEAIVKNAVGFNPERGDRFAIHQTRFDTSIDDQIAEEMKQERKNEQLQIYLRYGLMILALGLAVWLIRSATRRAGALARSDSPILLDEPLRARSLDGKRNGRDQITDNEKRRKAIEASPEEELVLVDDVYTSKLSPEARKRLKAKHLMYEEIKQQVSARPEETAELVRSWMAADVRHVRS